MHHRLSAILSGLALSVGVVVAVAPAATAQSTESVVPQVIRPTPVNARPQLDDSCIGADIGRTATDTRGNRIICDNYRWELNRGQQPRHPWADDQQAWTDCIQHHSTADCRQRLNH